MTQMRTNPLMELYYHYNETHDGKVKRNEMKSFHFKNENEKLTKRNDGFLEKWMISLKSRALLCQKIKKTFKHQ